MGVGIECYVDGDFELGNPPFFSDKSGFILGSVAISSANASGSVTDSMLADGNAFYYLQANSLASQLYPPDVSVAGTTITWTVNPHSSTFSGTLFYGIR